MGRSQYVRVAARSRTFTQLAPKRKCSKHDRNRQELFVAGLFICDIKVIQTRKIRTQRLKNSLLRLQD